MYVSSTLSHNWLRTYQPAQVDLDFRALSEFISCWKHICVTEQSGEQKPTAQTMIQHSDLSVGRTAWLDLSVAGIYLSIFA